MTTDQIRVSDATNDISRDAAALVDKANDEAKQIVAKARYDAFRMVTDARAEAESILAESDHGEAQNSSQGHDAAPLETSHGLESDNEELQATNADLLAVNATLQQANASLAQVNTTLQETNAALAADNNALEQRVDQTRALLASLEARLAQIAATPSPESPTANPVAAPSPPAPTRDDARPPAAIEPGRKAMRASAGPTHASTPPVEPPPVDPATAAVKLDYSPSVATPIAPDEPGDAAAPKGSFYSRRSAKLPHIGDSAGEDSFSAIRSMRAGLE